ncbi:MAG: antibiotic biosynthesis monooxygenase family protein [Pseudobdellovibrionaceae bacterium]
MSYYAVIFSSKRNNLDQTGYQEMSQKMIDLAKGQKGFLGVESARSLDGYGITVSYWDSLENIEFWKQNNEHQYAQKLGREKWYENFTVRICKVEHEYGLKAKPNGSC